MDCIGQKKSTLTTCADGMYSMVGDSYCTQCPGGYKCPEKHMMPLECEHGKHSVPGSMICDDCPSGHWCDLTDDSNDASRGDTEPSICAQGLWSPTGSYQCTDCPLGSKCDNAAVDGSSSVNDAATKVACEEYQITNDYHVACENCPAGFSCPLQLISKEKMCGPGFYSTQYMDYCLVSPAGYYAPDTRADPTEITEDGYYAEIGMTYKMRVLPNKERKTNDGRHQVLCKPGWYL